MSFSDNNIVSILNMTIVCLNRYILPIFFILGNIGNIFSIIIFLKKSWRKKVSVVYCNACLITNTCYINCTILSSILIFGFQIDFTTRNSGLCKIYYYVSFVFSMFLPVFLILASIDRLLLSSQNVETRLYSSKRLAHFSLTICSFLCLAFCTHVLIKVDIQQLGPLYFMCYYDLSLSYLKFVHSYTFIFTCIICATIIILCILSFKNVRRIRSVPRDQRNRIRTMTKKDFQLLRCLYVHNIVFIACGIEVASYYIYQTAIEFQVVSNFQQVLNNFIYYICVFVGHIPSCSSFYIFITISKAFRNDVKQILFKIFCLDIRTITHEEENEHETNVIP